jgi:hypothetical protein
MEQGEWEVSVVFGGGAWPAATLRLHPEDMRRLLWEADARQGGANLPAARIRPAGRLDGVWAPRGQGLLPGEAYWLEAGSSMVAVGLSRPGGPDLYAVGPSLAAVRDEYEARFAPGPRPDRAPAEPGREGPPPGGGPPNSFFGMGRAQAIVAIGEAALGREVFRQMVTEELRAALRKEIRRANGAPAAGGSEEGG